MVVCILFRLKSPISQISLEPLCFVRSKTSRMGGAVDSFEGGTWGTGLP